jgi:hypothetical protein
MAYQYENGAEVGEAPLSELSLYPPDQLAKIYTDVEIYSPVEPVVEQPFYNRDLEAIVPAKFDYSAEHTFEAGEVQAEIPDVLVRTGSFINNKSLDAVRADAEFCSRGHFVDERGDLTLLRQGDIDRLDQVTKDGGIPEQLGDLFDAERSPVTSVYSSVTKLGKGRDFGFEAGNAGVHIHIAQTVRFVFTQGNWEIVLMDLRPKSETYGRRVCLSFDADQSNQLAMVIPPGIAHTIACLRPDEAGADAAQLINFPTLGYAEIPHSIADEIDVENSTAVRAMEGRLDPTRVLAGTTEEDDDQRSWFDWLLYQRWILNQQKIESKEHDGRSTAVLVGGSQGLLGSLMARAYGEDVFVESVSRSQDCTGEQITARMDLTKLTTEQLANWLLAAQADEVILTAAWTDVTASIALAQFVNRYEERLRHTGLLGTDPVTELNHNLPCRLAQAIEHLGNKWDRDIKLVLPQTTMAAVQGLPPFNMYAATKRSGVEAVRTILGWDNTNVDVMEFGYPYVVDAEEVRATAKPMTLYKRIDAVIAAINGRGDPVPAFVDDAVDMHNLAPIVNRAAGQFVAADSVSDDQRSDDMTRSSASWLSTYELCELIVEEYADMTGQDAEELKNAALKATRMADYTPTNAQLLGCGEDLRSDNAVYQWMARAVNILNRQAEEEEIDLESFLLDESYYSSGYPSLAQVRQSPDHSDYVAGLRADIRQILERRVV